MTSQRVNRRGKSAHQASFLSDRGAARSGSVLLPTVSRPRRGACGQLVRAQTRADTDQIIHRFLGHEPDADAFLCKLGLNG